MTGPKLMLAGTFLAGAGLSTVQLDMGVFVALVGQFGAIIWWGSRMSTKQLEMRREFDTIEARLIHIERYGSTEVPHLIKAVERLTELVEDIQARLTRVEALCTIRHNWTGGTA